MVKRILTWNLCWGCLSNDKNDKTGLAVVNKCIEKTFVGYPPIKYACFQNIQNTIHKTLETKMNIDIYAFQEAIHDPVQNDSMDKLLKDNYTRKTTKFNLVCLTTYYNNKYTLVRTVAEGNFIESGRPFHILELLDNKTGSKFYFINGHIGHHINSISVNKVLTDAFVINKYDPSYEIIMAGDRNDRGKILDWSNTYIKGKKV